MRNCFVPGCDKKYKSSKRTMFNVPKDKNLFERWAHSLPNLRPLTHTDRVCYLHFQRKDIQSTFSHVIKGDTFELARERARLKPNAVPILNIPNDEELKMLKPLYKKYFRTRKKQTNLIQSSNTSGELQKIENLSSQISTNENNSIEQHTTNENKCTQDNKNRQDLLINENEDEFINEILPETKNSLNEIYQCFFDDIYEVELPNTLWGIHRCPQRSVILFTYMDIKQMSPTKILSINSEGTIKMILNKKLIQVNSLLNEENTIEMISRLVLELDTIT